MIPLEIQADKKVTVKEVLVTPGQRVVPSEPVARLKVHEELPFWKRGDYEAELLLDELIEPDGRLFHYDGHVSMPTCLQEKFPTEKFLLRAVAGPEGEARLRLFPHHAAFLAEAAQEREKK